MNWLTMFLQLLPTIVLAAEKIGSNLAGHEKKAAVQNGLLAVAQGVGTILPEHALAASHAASAAVAGIDGVVQVLNDVGALDPHKNEKAVLSAPVAPASTAASLVCPGPGLHEVVPA